MRVVVLLVLATASAAAQPAFVWQAPSSCPDDASLRARVERRLGRSLDAELVQGIDIAVAIEHHHYVARIDLRALTVANDVRTLTAPRCDELADAVAVVVARVARDIARAPKPIAVAVAPRVEHDDDEVAVHTDAAPPRLRPWTIGVRLSGVTGIGIVPEVGLGAELALTLRRHATLAELATTKWLASAADVRINPGHIDVGLLVTAARFGWRPEHLPLRAWASAETGTMSGVGVGVTTQVDSGRWLAAGAGFGVAWQMNKWARLVGSTEVLLAIERVRFTLADGMAVYAPSPMSARASCGLEIGWQ